MSSAGAGSPEGFLNIVKPPGWTSHDVVQLVRRLAGTRRVGHAGTLDPAATGVLVVAVGRATRLIDYLAGADKVYLGDVVFGAATDTDDAEGAVLSARDASHLTVDQLVTSAATFLGSHAQIPPQYSAVKLAGKKAYEIARKGGTAAIGARTVTIQGMAVAGWTSPVATLLVRCSKGTYIRSLARDLGQALGVGGHLGALVRLSVGQFGCEDAVGIEELKTAAEFGYLPTLLAPPDVAVQHLPVLILGSEHAEDMRVGRSWPVASEASEGGCARVHSVSGAFLGLVERSGGEWHPRVVLVEAHEPGT